MATAETDETKRVVSAPLAVFLDHQIPFDLFFLLLAGSSLSPVPDCSMTPFTPSCCSRKLLPATPPKKTLRSSK